MMQLEIPLHRSRDPLTSKVAAEKAVSFKARHISLIWDLLRNPIYIKPAGGLTPREVARDIGLDYIAVQRRGCEMERKGLITRGPDIRDGQKVWRAK